VVTIPKNNANEKLAHKKKKLINVIVVLSKHTKKAKKKFQEISFSFASIKKFQKVLFLTIFIIMQYKIYFFLGDMLGSVILTLCYFFPTIVAWKSNGICILFLNLIICLFYKLEDPTGFPTGVLITIGLWMALLIVSIICRWS
jgi:hypothetical protein